MRLITLVTRRAAGYRTRRSMFVPAWFSNEPTRSTPLDDRQIAPTLLSPSRDLAGAKRIAQAAACTCPPVRICFELAHEINFSLGSRAREPVKQI